MSDTTDPSFEMLYKAAIKSDEVSGIAKITAASVIERMMQNGRDEKSSILAQRIQKAASENDIELILKLTDELRSARTKETERLSKLVAMAEEFSFMEVLQAFPNDFKELAYELALVIIEQKRPKSGSKGSGSRPAGQTYIISRGGKSIEAQKNLGAPKAPVHEREFFEFMGFAISTDGRSLEPIHFTNKQGERVLANSKKNVIEDLLAGNPAWEEKGYRIKVKEATEQA